MNPSACRHYSMPCAQTGAQNVVIAGGLDWAYDMSGFLKGTLLVDPKGNGVIYANHTYPFKGDTVEKWIAKMETATRTLPVIVSEFGSESRIPGRGGALGASGAASRWKTTAGTGRPGTCTQPPAHA